MLLPLFPVLLLLLPDPELPETGKKGECFRQLRTGKQGKCFRNSGPGNKKNKPHKNAEPSQKHKTLI